MPTSQTTLLAHQLRASLTIIRSDLWLATQDKKLLPTNCWRHIQQALVTTNNLITMTNDILTVNPTHSQTIFLHPKLFHLKLLVTEILTELTHQMANKGLSGQINSVELDTVWADRNQIRQVFINLLDNAIKFSKPLSHIQIDISQSAHMMTVAISNQSQSKARQKVAKLLNQFDQNKPLSSALNHQNGHGFGLPICQQIIYLSGGKIWLPTQQPHTLSIAFSLPADRRACPPIGGLDSRQT